MAHLPKRSDAELICDETDNSTRPMTEQTIRLNSQRCWTCKAGFITNRRKGAPVGRVERWVGCLRPRARDIPRPPKDPPGKRP
jgi:hypothetical protein